MVNGQSAEKDFAYILGLYFGDAYIKRVRVNTFEFKLQAIDKDFVEHAASVLSRALGREIKVHTVNRKTSSGNEVYSIGCSDPYFKKILDDTLEGKVIPPYVYTWGKETKLEFLEAVMDSDGFISMRTNGFNYNFQCGYSVTYPWILDIKQLFESVDIRTKKLITLTPKPPRIPFYRFTLVLKSLAQSGFKFHIKRKQDRLDKYKEKHFINGEYTRFTHPITKPNLKLYHQKRRNSQRLHDKTE